MVKSILFNDTEIGYCCTVIECLNIKSGAILRVDKDLEQLNSHDLLLEIFKKYKLI